MQQLVFTQWILLLFILLAVFQDLKTKKVTNRFNVIAFLVVFNLELFQQAFTFSRFFTMLGGLGTALFLGYGLWRFRVIGAGDAKLFLVIGPTLVWQDALIFVFYTLVWGALLGLIGLLLDRQFIKELRIFSFHPLLTIRNSKMKGHKVPLTVGILLGILTLWTLKSYGVNGLWI